MTQAHERTATLSDLVAEEVRAMLARRRMSGRQLAMKLGVSPSWVSYRLTGTQEIGVNDLQLIAEALDVPALQLVTDAIRNGASRPAGTTRRDGGLNVNLPRLGRSAHVPSVTPGSPFPRAGSRPNGQPRKNVTRPGSPVPATRRRPVPVQPPKLPSLRTGLPMTA